MGVSQRMTFLSEAAINLLDDLRIPPPEQVRATVSMRMGIFEPWNWRIVLYRPLFEGSTLAEIANQAGHVFHEFEHLATTYVAARYLAASKQGSDAIASALRILAKIAENAAREPLPANLMSLGKACHFRVTCEKHPTAPSDYYRRLQGRVRKLQVELRLAEGELAKLDRSPSFSREAYARKYAQVRRIDKELTAAVREYQMSENELGSNVVQNLVKSWLLQRPRTAA